MEVPRNRRSQEEALEFLPNDDDLDVVDSLSVEEEAMHIEERRALEFDIAPADLSAVPEATSWFDDEEPEDRGDGAVRVRHGSTTPSLQDLLVSQHYAFDSGGEADSTATPRSLHARTLHDLRSERDKLRTLLPQLRTALSAEQGAELSPSDQHQADVATETYEREKDMSVLADLTARLRDIEEEIERRE